MITLAATDTLQAIASNASAVTMSAFGSEVASGTETYKMLYQGQLAASVTTVYTVPGSTIALIKTITVVNGSNDSQTFQLYVDGTASANKITGVMTLPPFTMAVYDDVGWTFYSETGAECVEIPSTRIPTSVWGPSFMAETLDRNVMHEVNTTVLSTGRLSVQAIWLDAGMVINWISFFSATTAAGTPTNQLFGLYDLSLNLLATTSNDTTTAWAANTLKTLKLTSSYTVPTSGLYYLGIMVTATTVPTLKGPAALVATHLHGTVPILCATSSTGLTTALPNPAAALTNSGVQIWGMVG